MVFMEKTINKIELNKNLEMRKYKIKDLEIIQSRSQCSECCVKYFRFYFIKPKVEL